MDFKCQLCKLVKSVSQKRGIILVESVVDFSNATICNLCYFRLHHILKSWKLDEGQQQFLSEWNIVEK